MILICRLLPLALAALATPALAYPGDWDRASGDGPRSSSAADDREGRVDAEHFVADGAAPALGHGRVAVISDSGISDAGGSIDARESATYEAALVDQLAHAGYDTATPDQTGGQIAEIHVVHDQVTPEEAPHRPLSGAMEMGVRNRGSSLGLALNIDMSKPKKALIETRLEARLRDRASGKLLWEGHAEIVTRIGSRHWTDAALAIRLAAALFAHFPSAG